MPRFPVQAGRHRHGPAHSTALAAVVAVASIALPPPATAGDNDNPEALELISATPGLVGLWDFSEPAGEPRVSRDTPTAHALREVNEPVPRIDEGPLSGHAARFDGSHFLRIDHGDTGDLNIHGADAAVSMIAFVRLPRITGAGMVAGMWYEGEGRDDRSGSRQYGLLLNTPAYGGPDRVTPHVSSEGGPSRRADGSWLPWCVDYAVNVSPIALNEWVSVGFTYDGEVLKAYYNGVMEPREADPEPDRRTDRYFYETADGSHRGMNPYYHGRGLFSYDPEVHAEEKPAGGSDFTVFASYAVGRIRTLEGDIGGLAVFDRALTAEEMRAIHDAALEPAQAGDGEP